MGLREKPTKWVPHLPLLLAEQYLEGLQVQGQVQSEGGHGEVQGNV